MSYNPFENVYPSVNPILKTDSQTGAIWGGVTSCGPGVHITQTTQFANDGLGAHVTTQPKNPKLNGTLSMHDYFDANGNYLGNNFNF